MSNLLFDVGLANAFRPRGRVKHVEDRLTDGRTDGRTGTIRNEAFERVGSLLIGDQRRTLVKDVLTAVWWSESHSPTSIFMRWLRRIPVP